MKDQVLRKEIRTILERNLCSGRIEDAVKELAEFYEGVNKQVAGHDEGHASGDEQACVIWITSEDRQRLMRATHPDSSVEDRQFAEELNDRANAIKAGDPSIEVRVKVFQTHTNVICQPFLPADDVTSTQSVAG